MHRRDFMTLCGAAGLGFAAPVGPSSIAGAAAAKSELPSYDGPFYVVFNAAGGWDTMYLMDPKGVEETNRLYKHGDIVTHGAHRMAPTRPISRPARATKISSRPTAMNCWF